MRRRYPDLHQRGKIHYFFWRDEQGKRHEESLRTPDIEIAKLRHQARTQEIRTGLLPNDLSDWSLQKAVAFWLDQRKLRVSRASLKSESSITRTLVRTFGGGATLRSVADIRRLCHYQNVRLKAGISPKSVNNELQVCAGVLQLAQLWHRVEPQYQPLRVVKSDLPDALTCQEFTRLLTAAANADSQSVAPHAAVLAFSTGMRSGEIKGLRLGDLHHDKNYPFLYVRRATTKTDSGARRVVLDTIGVWAVKKLVARARMLGCTSPEHYLLPTDRARHTRPNDPLHGLSGFDPLHPQSSWESEWRKFRAEVGIAHRRFHDLRHTYVTRAAEAGVAIAVVQAQIGHLSAEMTRWYTHISEQAQFKAACQIEDHNPELLDCLGLPKRGTIPVLDGGRPNRNASRVTDLILQ